MDTIIIGILFIVAFALALRSAVDFDFAREVEGFITEKRTKGSILFLKDKIVHYSSDSSSSSS